MQFYVCVCNLAVAQTHDQDNTSSTFFSDNYLDSRHFDALTVGEFAPESNVLFLGGLHGSRGLAWNAMEQVAPSNPNNPPQFKFTGNRNAFKMDYSYWNQYAVWRFSDNTPSSGTVVDWITAMQLQKTSSGIDLRLCGDFYAQEININAGIGWCDYVFAEDYKLMSLAKLEQYINTYKHLPEVPSEQEVYDSGIAVTEMLQIQMKKIEELTLYIIQQQKEIDELKATLETK